jgi:hypothetical protein
MQQQEFTTCWLIHQQKLHARKLSSRSKEIKKKNEIMKVENNNTTPTTKRVYEAPKVETIQIDSEISLVMMSPPGDPSPMAPLFNPLS